jgi:hypothetical protein
MKRAGDFSLTPPLRTLRLLSNSLRFLCVSQRQILTSANGPTDYCATVPKR